MAYYTAGNLGPIVYIARQGETYVCIQDSYIHKCKFPASLLGVPVLTMPGMMWFLMSYISCYVYSLRGENKNDRELRAGQPEGKREREREREGGREGGRETERERKETTIHSICLMNILIWKPNPSQMVIWRLLFLIPLSASPILFQDRVTRRPFLWHSRLSLTLT